MGCTIFFILTAYFVLPAGRAAVRSWLRRKPFLMEAVNIMQRLTWQVFFETGLRAETGKSLERPFGTARHPFDWSKIQLNPVYLSRKPLHSTEPVDTGTVIGPQAKKPLHISIPIMIAGMSYGGALSRKAKTALAKASALAGTAENSGNGPFIPEERAKAKKYILQYSKGFWSKSADILRQADMIEITLGHGAWGPAPVRIKGEKVTREFAAFLPAVPGLEVLIESRLPEVESMQDWKILIRKLRDATGGVPIAVKIGCTHGMESELDCFMESGVDAVVIDGLEGGTHSCPGILADDAGLCTMPGLLRAARHLRKNGHAGKISLIAGGGLSTPGQFLKCLAMGADAVIIGTVAILAATHTRLAKAVPWEPPTELVFHAARKAGEFNPDMGAQSLYHFLMSCIMEMTDAARSLGKSSLKEINRDDLVALDPLYAKMAESRYCLDGDLPSRLFTQERIDNS